MKGMYLMFFILIIHMTMYQKISNIFKLFVMWKPNSP